MLPVTVAGANPFLTSVDVPYNRSLGYIESNVHHRSRIVEPRGETPSPHSPACHSEGPWPTFPAERFITCQASGKVRRAILRFRVSIKQNASKGVISSKANSCHRSSTRCIGFCVKITLSCSRNQGTLAAVWTDPSMGYTTNPGRYPPQHTTDDGDTTLRPGITMANGSQRPNHQNYTQSESDAD